MITGDDSAFEQLFDAIPKAITDVKGSKYHLSPKDQMVMEEYKKRIFKD